MTQRSESIAYGKRTHRCFVPVSSPSLAAVALLFAIYMVKPSPFCVLDEIDAALDNVNVTRVADFIRERAEEGHNQFVVISLKDTFYEKAQALVGIYRDRQIECSRSVTLDLDKVAGVAA